MALECYTLTYIQYVKWLQNNKNIANIATYCSSNVREIGCRKTGCTLK